MMLNPTELSMIKLLARGFVAGVYALLGEGSLGNYETEELTDLRADQVRSIVRLAAEQGITVSNTYVETVLDSSNLRVCAAPATEEH